MTEAVNEGTKPTTTVTLPATPPVTPPLVPDPVAKPADEPKPVTFEPTGDAGLDLALGFFGNLGLTLDGPELTEAGKGNFSYLEAKLAAMGDKAKGWEQHVQLGKDAYGRLSEAEKTKKETLRKTVHDAVGGEENWKAIQEYVNANAEPAELEEVKAALSQGGIAAKAVAEMLHRQFTAASGTTVNPMDAVHNQATTPNPTAALTLRTYRDELDKLVSKIGSARLDGSPEYAALRRKYANVTK